ncbi:MAG: O-antigen ligase family protein [Planctomycetota bacterium]|nr:O-antigen ligase family protein [Planctomycetota bacterium]
MTKRNTSNAPARSAAATVLDRWAVVCFIVLVVIVGLRPLIQETHDTERMPFASVLAELPDISPLPTLWINLVIIGVFGWTMALRFQGRLPKPRRTGLMLGFVIVAIAAVASCFIAGNKRLAINTTLDWITLPLLAIALAHLLQHAWQMRLVLCVIVASGVASAVESFDQALNTLPQTVQMYEQNKEEYWQRQGVAPDSYQIELFEKRVYEQAANGFFAMANIAGSYFVLTIFAALALAGAYWASGMGSMPHSVGESAQAPDKSGFHSACGSLTSRMGHNLRAFLMALMGVPMIGALWFSKSRGALAALILGLFVVLLLYVFRHAVTRSRRRTFLFGWGMVAGGLGCVGAYGLAKGSLPGGSLTYRWWYLETTAQMVADHPLLGVGSGQYSRFYPRYKEIKSPEEISNPHNFLAQAAAEWGIGGLAGMILMLVGGSRAVAGLRISDCGMRNRESPRAPPHNENDVPRPMLWCAMLFVAIWTLQIWIVGHVEFNYIYAQLFFPMLGWMAVFAICTASANASSNLIKGSAFPITLAGILGVGLLAFLVHNLITFSLFIPGTATTFFALLGVCIAMRCDEGMVGAARPTPSPAGRGVQGLAKRLWLVTPAAVPTILAMILVYVFAIEPVGRCWHHLLAARGQVSRNQIPFEAYAAALSADLLDPTPAKGWADFRMAHPGLLPGEPFYPYATALGRDPHRVSALRSSAQGALALSGEGTDPQGLLQLAAKYYEKVLELYPSNPDDHLRMSEIQIMMHRADGDVAALERAILELKIATDLNRQRDMNEVRRFSPEKVSELKAKLARLKSMLADDDPRGLKPENP